MSAAPVLLSLMGGGIFLFFIIYFAMGINGVNSQVAQNDSVKVDACQRLLQYSGGTHECDVIMADFHNNCNTTWKPSYCSDTRIDNYLRARGYL